MTSQNLPFLLKTAHYFQMGGILKIISNRAEKVLNETESLCLISLFSLASLHNFSELSEIRNIAADKIASLIGGPSEDGDLEECLRRCDHQTLKFIITSKKIAATEETIFKVVVTWLRSDDACLEYTEELFKMVHLGRVPKAQLRQLMETKLRGYLGGLTNLVRSLLGEENLAHVTEKSAAVFTPRDLQLPLTCDPNKKVHHV